MSHALWRRLAGLEARCPEPARAPSAAPPFVVLLASTVEDRDGSESLAERYARALGYEGSRQLRQALLSAKDDVRERHRRALRGLFAREGVDLHPADDASVQAALGRLYGRVPAYVWDRTGVESNALTQ